MRMKTITILLIVLFLPAAVAVAGPVSKSCLTRGDGAAEDSTAKGTIKIKSDKKGGLHLFSVKIQNVDPGDYDVFLVDAEDNETDLGDITVADGEDSGKFKLNAKRGDTMPDDPVGMTVEVRSGEDVLLTGVVPDPDAPKVKGNAKSKLDTPEDPPIEKADGMVQLKVGPGNQLLSVQIRKVDPGTYDVFMADGEGDLEKVGEIVVPDGEGSGKWMVNDKRGDPLPVGATSMVDLQGRAVEVRSGEDVVLEGAVPTIEKKGRGPKK